MENIAPSRCRHSCSGRAGFLKFLDFLIRKRSLYILKTDMGRCRQCGSLIRVPDMYYAPFPMCIRMLVTILCTLQANWLFINSKFQSDSQILFGSVFYCLGTAFVWMLCNRVISAVTLAAYPWKAMEENDTEKCKQEKRAQKQFGLRVFAFLLPGVFTFMTMGDLRPTYLQFIIPLGLLNEKRIHPDGNVKWTWVGIFSAIYLASLGVVHAIPGMMLFMDALTIIMVCGLVIWEGYYR